MLFCLKICLHIIYIYILHQLYSHHTTPPQTATPRHRFNPWRFAHHCKTWYASLHEPCALMPAGHLHHHWQPRPDLFKPMEVCAPLHNLVRLTPWAVRPHAIRTPSPPPTATPRPLQVSGGISPVKSRLLHDTCQLLSAVGRAAPDENIQNINLL